MDFSVLGPLRVEDGNGPIEIRGGKERLLLARLVAASGRLVTTSELIDVLWDDDPPMRAAKSVQTFVLRLRNALEPQRSGAPTVLLTEGPGYRLAVDPGQVDAERLARLARIGKQALADGRPEGADRTLVEALGLWRGPAYAGFEADFARAEARRLEELRLAVTEDHLAADLALGRAAETIPELEQLVVDHPHRERLWEMFVTALYRTGRQADALGAYEQARSLLADELGVDPGAPLRAVHARVLAHDPTLGQPTSRASLPPELRPARDLVGRDGELQQLRDTWQRAVRGHPSSVVVRGPEGSGGSALAAAFAAEVAREGAEVRYVDPRTTAPASTAGPETPTLLVADHVPNPGDATLVIRLAGPGASAAADSAVIDLTPLRACDIRTIVADYVPPDAVDAVTEQIQRRSGGWPGAVHDAAADATREHARLKVAVAAAVADATTSELASARAELADNVAILEDTTTVLEPADPATCPWRGLAAYGVEDASWYAGRERLVAELVANLAGSRLLALVGASGAGKSSALRAGLLAALQRDVLPGSAAWPVVTLRPGRHPMMDLARNALGKASRDGVDLLADLVNRVDDDSSRVLVVVDQLEELWTACPDPAEQHQFLDTLAELATDPRSRVTVVVALRADFVGAATEHPAFRTLLTDGTVFVGPMTPAEIRRAVQRPAAVGQLTLEDGLADTIVSDAGQEPGLLPLLSAAMTQLWERRDGRDLTYPAYIALGGLSGAIATLAEESYAALPPDARATARNLLLRLTGLGDGAGVTRRRVPLAELGQLPEPASTHAVVEELTRARLLTVSRGSVEVAHEALFREWPRLRGWLEEDAAGRAVQLRLAAAAADWEDDQDPAMLWAGTRLESALEFARSRPEELTSTERAFVEASRDAVDAAQREAETRATATARQNRRLRRLLGGIAGVLILALVAGTLAWRAREQAQAASVSADAQRLAATALNIEEPDQALLAAVESTKLEQSPETYGALLSLLARQPRVVHRLRTPDQPVRITTGADGAAVFLGFPHRVSAVSTQTGRVLWSADMPAHGYVASVSVTPDGRGILVVEMGPGAWGVDRFDASTGRVDWQLREAPLAAAAPRAQPNVIGGGFRADGRFITVTRSHVFTLDPATGRVLAAVPWPQQFHTTFLKVWPDGKVSRDGPEGQDHGLVFDPAHPDLGTAHLEGLVLAVSPDASRVLVGRQTATGTDLRVVDGRTLKDLTRTIEVAEHVSTAAWSPDGSNAALGVERGVLALDPKTMALQRLMTGHSGSVNELVFTGAKGDLVWTAGQDGTSVAFDLSGTRTPITEKAADPKVMEGSSSAATHRGVYMVYSDLGSNTAFVSDTGTGRTLGQLLYDLGDLSGHWAKNSQHQAETVAMTPDGSTAIVATLAYTLAGVAQTAVPWLTDHGAVVIFDAVTRRQRAVVELPWPAYGIAVTPNSHRAVVNGATGYAVVDLTQARLVDDPVPMQEIPRQTGTNGAAISPDGRWAALTRDREIVVVDLTTGKVARRSTVAEEGALVLTLAWSANSRTLVAGTSTGWLHVLSAAELTAAAPPRHITGGWVKDLEVSPDGRMLASIGEQGDVMLWDTRTWRPYGQPVTDDRWVGWLTYSADGRALRVFFEDQHVVQISTLPKDWVTAACSAAGRNLTPAEAAVLLPGQRAHATCPDRS